jgi:Fe-S cluster assembly protein SufD
MPGASSRPATRNSRSSWKAAATTGCSAELSQPGDAGSGALALPLAEALEHAGFPLEPYLARLAPFDHDVFVALNTAHLRDGVVVIVPRDAVCEKPIHVLYVTTQPGIVTHPRCLVVAQPGARCAVIEEFVSLSAEAAFTNAVTEIAVAPNATVHHVKLQTENAASFHIARCAVAVERDAAFSSQTVALGARTDWR